MRHVLKDILVIFALESIVLVLNYFAFLPQLNVDLDKICMGVAFFALCWLATGFYFIMICEAFAGVWQRNELLVNEQE
jgi:hypothetical protein